MSETLSKQDLLLKILRMTTSDNDGQALVAIRKANALLDSAGWTWERLLAGKIVVVADPFASTPTPVVDSAPRAGTAPSRPQPRPASNPPSRPTPAAPPPPIVHPISARPNGFADFCWCCGSDQAANAAWIFKPQTYNRHTPYSGWKVICTPCNNSVTSVSHYPANPQRMKRRRSFADLV